MTSGAKNLILGAKDRVRIVLEKVRSVGTGPSMTDLFVEDDYEQQPGALDRLRAGVSRLEHQMHDSASGAVEDARMLVRRAQHRVNAQLGRSALIALGLGLVLGLAAAAWTSWGRSER